MTLQVISQGGASLERKKKEGSVSLRAIRTS